MAGPALPPGIQAEETGAITPRAAEVEADVHDMETENPQQDFTEAERVAAGSAASRRSAVQRENPAETTRRAAAARNEAIQAELEAFSAGQARILKRRTSDGAEAREERPQAQAAGGDWLNSGIAASLRTFGEHMDARINTIAEQTDATAGRLEDHIDRVDMMDQHWHEYAKTTSRRLGRHEDAVQKVVNSTAEMRSELEATNKRLAELEKKLRAKEVEDAVRAAQAPASSAQAAGSHSHDANRETKWRQQQQPQTKVQRPVPQPRPSSEPCLWDRVGNLGWDMPAQELQDRLDKALNDGGIDPDTITTSHAVVGRDGRGSAAEIQFKTEANLQTAKGKMRNSRQSIVPGKSIWLDVKKTCEELAPARAIHRAFDILTDIESRREDCAMLDKNVGGKLIFPNG